jgi:hypothetical protein
MRLHRISRECRGRRKIAAGQKAPGRLRLCDLAVRSHRPGQPQRHASIPVREMCRDLSRARNGDPNRALSDQRRGQAFLTRAHLPARLGRGVVVTKPSAKRIKTERLEDLWSEQCHGQETVTQLANSPLPKGEESPLDHTPHPPTISRTNVTRGLPPPLTALPLISSLT